MKSTERLPQCEGWSFWALKGTLAHPTGRPWANLREAFLLECSQYLLENSSGHLCRGKSPSIIIWEIKFPQKYAVSDHHKHQMTVARPHRFPGAGLVPCPPCGSPYPWTKTLGPRTSLWAANSFLVSNLCGKSPSSKEKIQGCHQNSELISHDAI